MVKQSSDDEDRSNIASIIQKVLNDEAVVVWGIPAASVVGASRVWQRLNRKPGCFTRKDVITMRNL